MPGEPPVQGLQNEPLASREQDQLDIVLLHTAHSAADEVDEHRPGNLETHHVVRGP
jgi:hypothetical protein